MVNTKVPESEWSKELAVGDDLELIGERELEESV
jgi:NADPH-dependent ferric siderophore reductase